MTIRTSQVNILLWVSILLSMLHAVGLQKQEPGKVMHTSCLKGCRIAL